MIRRANISRYIINIILLMFLWKQIHTQKKKKPTQKTNRKHTYKLTQTKRNIDTFTHREKNKDIHAQTKSNTDTYTHTQTNSHKTIRYTQTHTNKLTQN